MQNLLAFLLFAALLLVDAQASAPNGADAKTLLGTLSADLLPHSARVLIGYALLAFSTLLIWRQYMLLAGAERSVMPLLLGTLFEVLVPLPSLRLLWAAVALLCLALTVRMALREELLAQQASMVHRAGVMIGLATLLYPPMWPFVFLPLVALFYRSAVSVSRILLLLLGFAVPAAGLILTCYLLNLPIETYLPPAHSFIPLFYSPTISHWVQAHWPAITLWAFAILLWIVHVIFDRKPRSSRINSYLLGRAMLRTWVLLASCSALIAPQPETAQVLLGIPLGLALTRLFSDWQRFRPARWLFLALLAGMLVVLLVSRYPNSTLYPGW